MAERNIKKHLKCVALSARGEVMMDRITKEDVSRYIAEVGNQEFEKAFAMTDFEVLTTMLSEIAERIGGEDK